MIVGNGDVASALKKLSPPHSNLLFFASGISNSQCVDEKEYHREYELLLDQPKDKHLVYFSSLAIFYSDTPYTRHKKYMEGRIKRMFANYTIVRLGNIDWGTNPHTLINYLRAHPDAEIRDEYRYVIGQEEFLHWMSLIPRWDCEMNCPGKLMKVKEIKDEYCK